MVRNSKYQLLLCDLYENLLQPYKNGSQYLNCFDLNLLEALSEVPFCSLASAESKVQQLTFDEVLGITATQQWSFETFAVVAISIPKTLESHELVE